MTSRAIPRESGVIIFCGLDASSTGTSSVKSSIPGMGSFIYFFSTSSTKAPSRGTMSSIFVFYFFAAWFIFFFSRRDACNFIIFFLRRDASNYIFFFFFFSCHDASSVLFHLSRGTGGGHCHVAVVAVGAPVGVLLLLVLLLLLRSRRFSDKG